MFNLGNPLQVIGAYTPLFKNTFEKKSKQLRVYIPTFHVSTQMFTKNYFLWLVIKRQKKCLTQSRFVVPQFILITQATQNIFLWNLLRENIMFECTPKYFFRIFNISNTFFHNGSIYFYERKHCIPPECQNQPMNHTKYLFVKLATWKYNVWMHT